MTSVSLCEVGEMVQSSPQAEMHLRQFCTKLCICKAKDSIGHDFDAHSYTPPPILTKASRILATIKFNFKNIFSDIAIYTMYKIKLTAKYRGVAPPGSTPGQVWFIFVDKHVGGMQVKLIP